MAATNAVAASLRLSATAKAGKTAPVATKPGAAVARRHAVVASASAPKSVGFAAAAAVIAATAAPDALAAFDYAMGGEHNGRLSDAEPNI